MDPITWIALAGINAALSSAKASQAGKQRKMEADLRAAEIEAAPWTGKTPSTQISTVTPNIWGELAGAGINTLGQGAALKGAGLFTSSSTSQGLGPENPFMQEDIGNTPTLFGRTPSKSLWNLGQYKFG